MKEAEKGVVLNRLYIAMKEALSDSCHGIYDSYYKKELKAVLGSAENLKLTWGDFYDMHYRIVEDGKQKCISELINGGLENQIIKEENEGVIKVGSPSDYLELSSSLPLGEAYKQLFEKRVAKIEEMQIVKKFPEDKLIDSGDLSMAEHYFSGNLRFD